MKTIKIIDLLNKIANGEEVPKKIKWEEIIYAYSEYDKDYLEYLFSDEEYEGLFNMKDNILTQFLNDEVEILEEEKKIPKKLEPLQKDYMTLDDIKFTFSNSEMIIVDKINDIIDYLESKERGE